MRTRLVIASLAAAVCLAGAVPAAAQDMPLGVKIGVNVATFSFDEDDFGLEGSSKTGLMAGAFIRRQISEGFGLQIEGLITQKGAKLDDTFFDDEFDITINYLEIPVLARYEMPFGTGDTSFHVYGGPAFALKISDHQELDGDEIEEDFEQDLKGADVGLAIGAGVDFNMWVVDVRYTFGLMNINDDPGADDFPVRNRVFTVGVGYRFR